MGAARVMSKRGSKPRHELMSAPIRVAFPEPANKRRVAESLGIKLDRVRELMRNHAGPSPECIGVNDNRLGCKRKPLPVLFQSGARNENVDLVRHRVTGHRQRGTKVPELRPHLLKPELLPRQKGRIFKKDFAGSGVVVSVIKCEVFALRNVGRVGSILLEQRSIGGALRLLWLRSDPLGFEPLCECAVPCGERFGRVAAEAKIIANENQNGFGAWIVLAPELDKPAANLVRPVLHRLFERIEMPGTHLLSRCEYFAMLDAQGLGIERSGLHAGGHRQKKNQWR